MKRNLTETVIVYLQKFVWCLNNGTIQFALDTITTYFTEMSNKLIVFKLLFCHMYKPSKIHIINLNWIQKLITKGNDCIKFYISYQCK